MKFSVYAKACLFLESKIWWNIWKLCTFTILKLKNTCLFWSFDVRGIWLFSNFSNYFRLTTLLVLCNSRFIQLIIFEVGLDKAMLSRRFFLNFCIDEISRDLREVWWIFAMGILNINKIFILINFLRTILSLSVGYQSLTFDSIWNLIFTVKKFLLFCITKLS